MTFRNNDRILVVHSTPADVCENCGQPYIAADVTAQLLTIATAARKLQGEVLVRDYAPGN